jgi:hypothetical protein
VDEVGAIAQSNRTMTITEPPKDDPDPPLIQFNLSFIIAIIIGLGIGIGAGVGGTYAYLSTSIAKKYRKVQQLETRGGDIDAEPSFRGGANGGREPPVFRGGDGGF